MKELTYVQIEKFKIYLIKVKNDLIEKFKKKEDKENKFYGLKDIRYLFDQNDDDDEIYEEIEYLFSENDLEYEEIKEYANDIYERIKQEEVSYEYKYIKQDNYGKTKPCLTDNKQIIREEKKTKKCLIDYEYIIVEEGLNAVKLKIKMILDMKKSKC